MRLLKTTKLLPRLNFEETRLFQHDKNDEKVSREMKLKPDRTILSGGRKLRHELKYLIDEGTYIALRSRLRPLMSPDGNGDNGEYRVTSLYFDDIYNSGYWQKLNGMETRRKFRVRAYNLDPSVIHLEAKHKDESYVSKLSHRLTWEQYQSLLSGDSGFMLDHDSEEDVFGEYCRSDLLTKLRPRTIVDYRREALTYPFGNVRITFDKKLSVCMNTLDMFSPEARYSMIYDKEIILEVKFDNYIPESIQAALHGLNAPMQPVSKYIICTDRMLEVKSHG